MGHGGTLRRTKSAFEIVLFATFLAFLSVVVPFGEQEKKYCPACSPLCCFLACVEAVCGEQTKELQLICSPHSSLLRVWRWVREPSWRTKEEISIELFALFCLLQSPWAVAQVFSANKRSIFCPPVRHFVDFRCACRTLAANK